MLVAAWTASRTLAIETRPDPEPGAGETLVRVEACGICGSDLHFFRGEFSPVPGMVPGHEIAGTVIETVGGTANTLAEGIHSVRPGGIVVALGVFMGEATIPAFKLVNQEIRLAGSLMYGHTSGASEFGAAVALLLRYRPELSQLQTVQFPLGRANDALETALNKTRGTIKATILPNG